MKMNDYLKKKTKRALSYCQAANLKAEKESMYSKLLIWSTINTNSAICKTWQIFLPCLPSDRQRRQPRFHRTWDFRAFSRGRCEDCSLALSLRKMSGISDGDLLLSPEAYSLLTCHNVASAFFRLLESVKRSPQETALQGFVKSEETRLLSANEHGLSAKRGSPARGAAQLLAPAAALAPARRCPALAAHGAVRHRPTSSNARSDKVSSWSERQWDFWSRLENWVPRLLFAERTKTYDLLFTSWKTQFVALRRFLHSAEPNVSCQIALWAAAPGSTGPSSWTQRTSQRYSVPSNTP